MAPVPGTQKTQIEHDAADSAWLECVAMVHASAYCCLVHIENTKTGAGRQTSDALATKLRPRQNILVNDNVSNEKPSERVKCKNGVEVNHKVVDQVAA